MSKRDTTLTLPDGFSGFERMLLTANGNLQRLIRYRAMKSIEGCSSLPMLLLTSACFVALFV